MSEPNSFVELSDPFLLHTNENQTFKTLTLPSDLYRIEDFIENSKFVAKSDTVKFLNEIDNDDVFKLENYIGDADFQRQNNFEDVVKFETENQINQSLSEKQDFSDIKDFSDNQIFENTQIFAEDLASNFKQFPPVEILIPNIFSFFFTLLLIMSVFNKFKPKTRLEYAAKNLIMLSICLIGYFGLTEVFVFLYEASKILFVVFSACLFAYLVKLNSKKSNLKEKVILKEKIYDEEKIVEEDSDFSYTHYDIFEDENGALVVTESDL